MRKHTILFLAANPDGTDARALDQEARAIQEELERSGSRDCFAFETRWAARPLDLVRELRKLKPTVVHFSGHGGEGGLFFQNPTGQAQLVSTAAFAATFGAAGASVRLVVLSACYSEAQAEALLAHVGCIVGMSSAIHHHTTKTFAVGFYGGLGDGESVEVAFRQGRAAISLEGLSDSDQPQLRVHEQVDASRLVLGGTTLGAPLPPPDHGDSMELQVKQLQERASGGAQHAPSGSSLSNTLADVWSLFPWQQNLTGWGAAKFLKEHGNLTGATLGNYRLLEPLGMGGSGVVFKAVHQGFGRAVALKLCYPLPGPRHEIVRATERTSADWRHCNTATSFNWSILAI
jgi:hypothetical protein